MRLPEKEKGWLMTSYIIRRICISLLTVFIISVFVFSIMHILPGDPVKIALGEGATQEMIDEYRAKLYLDRPIIEQYFIWIRNILLHGDYGTSIMYEENVGSLMREKLPVTLSIGIPTVILSVIFGLFFGILSAVKRGSWIDQVVTFIANLGIATPQFWIAIMGILVFGKALKILPIQGYTAPGVDFIDYLHKGLMPIVFGSLGFIATITRQTRSNMLEVINQDYVRTARANGLKEKRVIYRHALKNALIPVVTIIGLQVRVIVGGSVVIERIFNIPGIGQLLMRAISNRDYLIVQACVMVISLVTVASNFIVDLAYGIIDPQIRKNWE